VLAEERLEAIRHQLQRDGKVVAAALAKDFGVSEDTIRRDLRDLAKDGTCRKVYGGAVVTAPDRGSIGDRMGHEASAKARLAAQAVKLINAGQTVFIDSGSTNLAIAAAIPRDLPITVATNAPCIVGVLEGNRSATIVVLGGTYNRDKGACLGATTLAQIEMINADLCFLGVCGLHPDVGITAFDDGEAEIKRAMVRKSRKLVVATMSDKIPTIAPFQVSRPKSLDYLVVGRDIDLEALEPFVQLGTSIHYAD
jgi:DeoR/GlpR family transcriptional regulator of sugar metabolism